jgi:hypothetical protein
MVRPFPLSFLTRIELDIDGLLSLRPAPKSMSDHDIKTMFGRKVAIDASMRFVLLPSSSIKDIRGAWNIEEWY